MSVLHRIGAILAGLFVGGVSVSLIQQISNTLYRPPADVDVNDWEKMLEWASELPAPAFLIVLVSWAAGCFVGAFVARRITRDRSMLPGVVVWGFFAAATIATLFMIPHPWWMWPSGLLACLVFGLLGLVLAGPSEYVVETERIIGAPIEMVFQTLARAENFSSAVPGITSIDFLSEQKYGVGTKFVETRIMHGREVSTELEVTELIENERIRILSDAGGTVWDTVFKVAPIDAGARMSMRMNARPHGLRAKLLTPLMIGMVDTAVRADMDAVKDYCES